jgi:hypothetical protein
MMRIRSAFVVLAALAAVLTAPTFAQAPAAEQVTVTCTLNHPAYSGSCLVDTTAPKKTSPSQACAPVLDCLNKPGCTRTYCNASTIRGGWQLVDAKVKGAEKK